MKAIRGLSLLLLCLLIGMVFSAQAETMLDAAGLADALRGTSLEGHALSCQTFAVDGDTGKDSAYAIASSQGKHVLCAFEAQNGTWQLLVANEHIFPEGSTQVSIAIDETRTVLPLVVLSAETTNGSIQVQFCIDMYENRPYAWPLFEVVHTVSGKGGEMPSVTQIAPSEETGKWMVTVDGNYTSYENRCYTHMEDFDIRTFPLTRAAADDMWHSGGTTAFIEIDDRKIAGGLRELVGVDIMLPEGQMIPVYSAPYELSLRGGDGKAAVSTNAPLTVYATEFDWVLISYSVSSGERFGYIPKHYIPADVSIDHDIMQETSSIGLTTREVAVLDNLSTPDAPLCILPYQTPLEVYGRLGDWLYVSGSTPAGESFGGFIPIDAFHHTNNF